MAAPKWIDVVKKQLASGKKTNPAYSLKDAMKDARPVYESMKKGVSTAAESVTKVVTEVTRKQKTPSPSNKSKGKRKSKGKGKGKGKSGRKTRGNKSRGKK